MSDAITVTTKNDIIIDYHAYMIAKEFIEILRDGDPSRVYPIEVLDIIIQVLTKEELKALRRTLKKNGLILVVSRDHDCLWTWGDPDKNKIPGHIYEVDEWFYGWPVESPIDLGLI